MRFLGFAFVVLICFAARAADVQTAPIVSVEYIHKYILEKWSIDVPYNPSLESKSQAANMKYLLTAVDVANEILNGFKITNYGENGTYATLEAVNTVAAIQAIDTLINFQAEEFWYIATGNATNATIHIQEGVFRIDWGDGNTEVVTHTDGSEHQTHSHSYTDGAPQHTVRIKGRVTKYMSLASKPNESPAAIQFWSHHNQLVGIGGCLGCLFPTIGDGSADGQQPTFYKAFSGQGGLNVPIPVGFLNGLHGRPSHGMFHSMFENSGITHLPVGMFANISGSAAGVTNTFRDTFKNCNNLTSIPADFFGDITDVENREFFWAMFYGDRNLTGPAPKINGKYLWEWWPNLQTQMFTQCNLDEQSAMPAGYRN